MKVANAGLDPKLLSRACDRWIDTLLYEDADGLNIAQEIAKGASVAEVDDDADAGDSVWW